MIFFPFEIKMHFYVLKTVNFFSLSKIFKFDSMISCCNHKLSHRSFDSPSVTCKHNWRGEVCRGYQTLYMEISPGWKFHPSSFHRGEVLLSSCKLKCCGKLTRVEEYTLVEFPPRRTSLVKLQAKMLWKFYQVWDFRNFWNFALRWSFRVTPSRIILSG